MDVFYITMQFPSPSETFACVDVKKLFKHGVNVSVHSMKHAHRLNKRFISERGLENLHITHNSFITSIKGMVIGLFNPLLLLKLFFWIMLYNFKQPKELIKSLILVPRALYLFKFIQNSKPVVVHLFWGHYPSIVGFLIKKEIPDIILSIFLGAYDLNKRYGLSGPTAQLADVIWTHTWVNVKQILDLKVPKDNIKVVHRGIDINSLLINETKIKIKKKIVSAGRLIESKGMDDVIVSFSRIQKHHPEATLTIIGEGPAYENLNELCSTLNLKHAVNFLGHVSHKNVIKEMNEAEIFLFMSKSERLPNVVKEAMANKCVCIVTNTPGIDELIQDEVHGFIIPQGDINAAVEKVLHVFSNWGNISHMIDNAIEHLKDSFDVEKQILIYENTWKYLVERKNERCL